MSRPGVSLWPSCGGRSKSRESGQEVLAITQERGRGPGGRAGPCRDAVRSRTRRSWSQQTSRSMDVGEERKKFKSDAKVWGVTVKRNVSPELGRPPSK